MLTEPGSHFMSDSEAEKDEKSVKPDELPVVHVANWFGGRREICLELDGVRYRLRITRKNKLILQK
jgi:hemin uptake protein HemP